MRARLAFLLTALTLLFLLQGLSAWFATLFALGYDAIIDGRSSAWMQMLLPLAALFAPAVPLARRVGREPLLVYAVALAAIARIALSLPTFDARWIASSLVVAAGFTFVSAAVGCLNRRAVTAGAAAALLLAQVLRFAGNGWDVTLRPGVAVFAQCVLSAAAVALAGYWLLVPERERDDELESLERRAGGLRLRGAVVLACVLFLELTVLARPAVIMRWTDLPYDIVAVALITVTAAAVVMHTRVQLPPHAHRPLMLACALLAGGAAALAPRIGGAAAAVLLVLGHAAAVALLARALIPGGGRRKGWTSSVAAIVLLALGVAYGLTFFAAFTIPALREHGPTVHAVAGGLLAVSVALLPRPAAIPPFVSRIPIALSAAAVTIALALAIGRARTPAHEAGFSDVVTTTATAPQPTWPVSAPTVRIDWLWVRGYDVRAARTSAGGGSDHRLVAATIRLPRTGGKSTTP